MDNEKKKTNRPNNVARIPCSLSDSFFRYWFMFWEPFHKLTKREIDVAATLVKIRYELSKVVKDEIILDKLVMSEDTIKTKKKDKSVWKSLGMAAMAVVAVAGTIAKEMNKK